jgi:hypothetical protein
MREHLRVYAQHMWRSCQGLVVASFAIVNMAASLLCHDCCACDTAVCDTLLGLIYICRCKLELDTVDYMGDVPIASPQNVCPPPRN